MGGRRAEALKDPESALPLGREELFRARQGPVDALDPVAPAAEGAEGALSVLPAPGDEVRPGPGIGEEGGEQEAYQELRAVLIPEKVLGELAADELRAVFPQPEDGEGIKALQAVSQVREGIEEGADLLRQLRLIAPDGLELHDKGGDAGEEGQNV